MALVTLLLILSRCFVTSEAIGIREIFMNKNQTDPQPVQVGIIQNGERISDIDGKIRSDVSLALNHTVVDQETVFEVNRTRVDKVNDIVNGSEYLGEFVNTTRNVHDSVTRMDTPGEFFNTKHKVNSNMTGTEHRGDSVNTTHNVNGSMTGSDTLGDFVNNTHTISDRKNAETNESSQVTTHKADMTMVTKVNGTSAGSEHIGYSVNSTQNVNDSVTDSDHLGEVINNTQSINGSMPESDNIGDFVNNTHTVTDKTYFETNETTQESTRKAGTPMVAELKGSSTVSVHLGDFDNNTPNVTEMVHVEMNETSQYSSHVAGIPFVLPLHWTDFCEVANQQEYSSEFTAPVNLTLIKCNVTQEHSGMLKLKDLRQHLDNYSSTDLKYSMEIECDSWSNISVSWPMKIANMYKLTVKYCQILDFLAEFKEDFIQTTPDSLRVLDLSDNKVLVDTNMYIGITKNAKDILPEYNCGHDNTLETMSTKNLSYHFIDSFEAVFAKLTALGEKFILEAKRLPVKCYYKHLLHLDESQANSMSIYHTDLKDAIFDELRVYNLSNSYIRVLKDKQLQWSISFPKLEMFDLSHNRITKLYRFEVPIHTRQDQITTINLQYNQINSISVEDLDRFKIMPTMFIDLRNNPIDCNCTSNMKQLLNYIKQKEYLHISNLTDYSYIKDLQCVRPKELQSRTLASITDIDVLCKVEVEKEYFLVPILILSCTIVVLSILLLALLRYRKEVLIILFTRFNIIVPCQQRHHDDSSKTYDAFVSYSSSEEEWVERVFEELEQQLLDGARRFKFCLHHRDFIPGRTIFDNVIKSVESSRHTIILLSNTFLKSEYCLYEFQEAFRQSIMEQKRHLVIVMMEELDSDKLPRDLKRCINTFTYIWKDDYLFRERLVYALSVKQKHRVVESKIQTVKYTPPANVPPTANDTSLQDIRCNQDSTLTPGKTLYLDKNDKQVNTDTAKSGRCKMQMCNTETDRCCDRILINGVNCPSKLHNSSTDLINIGSDYKNNIKRVSEKSLALNIETDDKKREIDCDVHDVYENIDKFDCSEMIKRGDMVVRAKDYDRSISTASSGYFSEKSSPDICSNYEDGFDKNVFSNTHDNDITDFVV